MSAMPNKTSMGVNFKPEAILLNVMFFYVPGLLSLMVA
jgi:hypothetical protein